MSEAIFVEGLTKAYGGKTVVDHLNLSVKSGTVFGLLGANGAGKSTAIECMLGTKRADGGTVRLLGRTPRSAAARFSSASACSFRRATICQKEFQRFLYNIWTDEADILRISDVQVLLGYSAGTIRVWHHILTPNSLFGQSAKLSSRQGGTIPDC